MSNDLAIRTLLEKVRTIALVGASDKPFRDSYRVLAYLLDQGYEVIPVNPSLAGKEILGQKVFPSLESIAQPIELVDIFRNSEAAGEVIDDAIRCGAVAIWMQLGVRNPEGVQRAIQAGLQVVENSCPKMDIARLSIKTPKRSLGAS